MMTTIDETLHHQPHAGIFHRLTSALGRVWTKVISLPQAPANREVPPEVWRFPPF